MSRGKATPTPVELRELVRDAIPSESVEYGAEPPPHQFFVPKSHARALHLNIPLVVGDRGAGKTFWWSALQSSPLRGLVEKIAPDTRIKQSTLVKPGFGRRQSLEHYPSPDVLAGLLSGHQTPRQVWKTVMVWAVVDKSELPELPSWTERVSWFVQNSERADRLVQAKDEELIKAEEDVLVVFDALDWAANAWDDLFAVVEGLLQVALEFRASRRIRVKVFLRTDQFDDRRVARFPDASKLVSSHVRLNWRINELFGLLWQLLAFHPEKGMSFQTLLFEQIKDLGAKPPTDWLLPAVVYFDTKVQERLFHALTGPYMGENARRGFPYTWLPSHLADAHGEVSPRSFLVALRSAAEHSIESHAGWGFALHPRSLYAGLQAASNIRVDEIGEHRWVPEVMGCLKDQLLVPFTVEALDEFWQEAGTLKRVRDQASANDTDQPWFVPAHIDAGTSGVCGDLETLGVFRRMRDGRIDVPDIYRLGFGLRRKGGVAPKRRGR